MGLVLAAAVVLVVIGTLRSRERTFTGTLMELLPQARDVPGWAVTYRPVAETAELQKATAEMLNYDDAVYAIYTHGETRISVYAAYWLPGKMSSRLIAGHTPDVCWVGAGWVPLKAEQTVDGVEENAEIGKAEKLKSDAGRAEENAETGKAESGNRTDADGGEKLRSNFSISDFSVSAFISRPSDSRTEQALPMEYRVFQLSGQTEYVVFCQVVGGRALNYGTGGLPPWYGFLSDLVARGFRQREEQFFLRISSNRPLEEFRETEPVTILLKRFRKVFNREVRE